jgi:hypothetical protein
MTEEQTRTAILKMANPSRKAVGNRGIRRIKLNHKPRDFSKPNLARHGLKGAPHGPSRHPA